MASAALVALALVLPGPASARDSALARGPVLRLWALDGTIVYQRALHGPWMRIVNGRVRRARGMPATRGDYEFLWGSNLGRDRKGRAVMTVRWERDVPEGPGAVRPVSVRWWLYDVAADRSRRLRSADECDGGAVAMWRTRLACAPHGGDVLLRTGNQTQTLEGALHPYAFEADRLALRGSTLAGISYRHGDDEDIAGVRLFADASGPCSAVVPGTPSSYMGPHPTAVWVAGGYVIWAQGTGYRDAEFTSLRAARLKGHCRVPTPTKPLFTPPSGTVDLSIDGASAYYTDGETIFRHPLHL